jgi:DNA-binding NarL/FixJ family response regulator
MIRYCARELGDDVGSTVRVAIVEDEPLFLELLAGSLDGLEISQGPTNRAARVEVVTNAVSARAARELDATTLDVLVTDLHLGHGETSGFDIALELKKANPALGVVILSNMVLPSLFSDLPRDFMTGWAYLLKTSVSTVDQLAQAIRVAQSGGMLIDVALMQNLSARRNSPIDSLSDKQRQVLNGITAGWSNRRIAEHLGVSVRTVESIVSTIFMTLGISTTDGEVNARVACVLSALEHFKYDPDRAQLLRL